MDTLTKEEINKKLNELNNWHFEEGTLQRSFEFKNFMQTFSIMTHIAMEAEKMNHHPYWENVYNSLKIKLSTHDANGVTKKDFELAKRIDALVK